MNADIAKERISYVARPDSITSSDGDFLATHVALKKLKVLNKFELSPFGGNHIQRKNYLKSLLVTQRINISLLLYMDRVEPENHI